MSAPHLGDYSAYSGRRLLEQPCPSPRAPFVSVVTVTLNACATIERTIRSVHAQSFPSLEQVFVDGGSTDGTLDIIRRLMRPQDYCLSEKDDGISDAFNKGVALARGNAIQILNADDWLSSNQLALANTALENSGADFIFGDALFYDRGQAIFRYAGDPRYHRAIHRRWPAICHPSVLATRSGFERVGLFDPAYRNAMDYDWLLRLHRAGAQGVYCPGVVAHMTHAGVSNRQFARTIEEVRQIATMHGRHPFVAAVEARARRVKTTAAEPIKYHFRPLYQLIRRTLNPSYLPVPAGHSSNAAP